MLQDHLEQIDVGLGTADDADATSGELYDLCDRGRGLLALGGGLAGRGHPEHRDVLAQRCHGLRIFRHIEVAPDNGEIGLALAEQLGARQGAIGLRRAQPDLAVLLVVEGLRHGLDDLEVFAVGRADRDPQGHRPHREVIAGRQRADDCENTTQDHERQPPPCGAERGRKRRFSGSRAVGHQFLNGRLRFNFMVPTRLHVAF